MPEFDTPDPIVATVELGVGDLRVTAADRPGVLVDVRPSDPALDLDVHAAEQTRVEYTDERLLVRAPKQRGLGLFGKPGSIDVEITLPAGSELRAEAGLAAVQVAGTLGACRIKTGTGDVHLQDTGPLDLSTASGDVTVGTVTGTASVHTASGTLRVARVDGAATVKNSNGDSLVGEVTGDLRAQAGNGSIVVDRAGADVVATSSNGDVRIGAVTAGSVSLKTAMGDLEVGIPAGTAAHLDLHTQFGNVVNRLDTAAAPLPGEPVADVRARTSYGDIVVRRP
jgi:DUF4097 and DUF4098 domain-containing protein YvlB